MTSYYNSGVDPFGIFDIWNVFFLVVNMHSLFVPVSFLYVNVPDSHRQMYAVPVSVSRIVPAIISSYESVMQPVKF